MFSLLLSACSKDDSDGPDQCLLSYIERTSRDGNYRSTWSIDYDGQNRVYKTNASNDSSFLSFTAFYDPGKITLKTKYFGDKVYTIGASGRVTGFSDFDGYETVVLTYNDEGFLSKVVVTFDYSIGT